MGSDWETPDDFFSMLNQEFNFDLDVCANAKNHKCKKYFTIKDDGLKKDWVGICWCNPPYGNETKKWIRKAYEESKNGAIVVCLVPNRTETEWFHKYALKGEIRFIRGRINFVNGGRPRFGSIIVIFRGN